MRSRKVVIIIIMIQLFFAGTFKIFAGEEEHTQPVPEVKVGGRWFLSYLSGEIDGEKVSLFAIKRGYINVKVKLNEIFSGRITPDISIDREGDGAGDIELRLKYAYLKYQVPDLLFLKKAYVEFGLVHRPWLNFQENLNGYRLRGTMFLARNGVISSADFGVSYWALLGGEMGEEYQEEVSDSYPGLYGSISFGFTNGGGYHAFEQNHNKPFESRLSIRPLPFIFPGFQISYAGAYGKGNTVESPDWVMHYTYLSMEEKYFTLCGSYYTGIGNFLGKAVDSLGNSLDQEGYSFFGDYKIPVWNISIMGRYDIFRQNRYGIWSESKRYIVGIAYHLFRGNKFMIDYDYQEGGSFFWRQNFPCGIYGRSSVLEFNGIILRVQNRFHDIIMYSWPNTTNLLVFPCWIYTICQ